MKTVKDALSAFSEGLRTLYDPSEANSIAYITIEEIAGLSKAQLRAFPEKELAVDEAERLSAVLGELKTGKPLQYILGNTEFYGLLFKVTPAVLIPRPETEELVEWVLETVKHDPSNQNILDIGTGSGCIPITLKKYLPQAVVSAIDISEEALSVAKQNAELNKVDVNFIEADILNPTNIAIRNTPISLLISNPPYVTNQEKTQMHVNVLDHEPHLALFVSDYDPLIFYRAIADFALIHLQPSGHLFFEINENLGEKTVQLLRDKNFKNIELRQDLRGKDRMIKASR